MTWRDRFREDNELLLQLVGGWRGRVYLVIALATLIFQMRARLGPCDGFISCWATLLKGAIWSLVWPFYWINYATDFVLFKPYSWT
jgi:hypothetical protein